MTILMTIAGRVDRLHHPPQRQEAGHPAHGGAQGVQQALQQRPPARRACHRYVHHTRTIVTDLYLILGKIKARALFRSPFRGTMRSAVTYLRLLHHRPHGQRPHPEQRGRLRRLRELVAFSGGVGRYSRIFLLFINNFYIIVIYIENSC